MALVTGRSTPSEGIFNTRLRITIVVEPPPSKFIASTAPRLIKISVSHEAIEQWQWPAMVMDFNVSSKVDIDSLTVGMSLHIEIETLDENQYEVSAIHIQEGSAELQAIDEQDSESHESESQSRQNNQQDKE